MNIKQEKRSAITGSNSFTQRWIVSKNQIQSHRKTKSDFPGENLACKDGFKLGCSQHRKNFTSYKVFKGVKFKLPLALDYTNVLDGEIKSIKDERASFLCLCQPKENTEHSIYDINTNYDAIETYCRKICSANSPEERADIQSKFGFLKKYHDVESYLSKQNAKLIKCPSDKKNQIQPSNQTQPASIIIVEADDNHNDGQDDCFIIEPAPYKYQKKTNEPITYNNSELFQKNTTLQQEEQEGNAFFFLEQGTIENIARIRQEKEPHSLDDKSITTTMILNSNYPFFRSTTSTSITSKKDEADALLNQIYEGAINIFDAGALYEDNEDDRLLPPDF